MQNLKLYRVFIPSLSKFSKEPLKNVGGEALARRIWQKKAEFTRSK
jgi:hypothetical protein